jgi:peroxiredoxin
MRRIPVLAWKTLCFSVALLVCGQLPAQRVSKNEAEQSTFPAVGDEARDFELTALDGTRTKLSSLTKERPVVLVVLRGFPGYQCPVCSKQVGQLLGKSNELKDTGANVVLIYPGPAQGLKEHGEEFIRGKSLPANFHLLLDPDYKFTRDYRLRWDAPKETAYPATFVIDRQRKIQFAKISKSHGGRASADDILQALRKPAQ